MSSSSAHTKVEHPALTWTVKPEGIQERRLSDVKVRRTDRFFFLTEVLTDRGPANSATAAGLKHINIQVTLDQV